MRFAILHPPSHCQPKSPLCIVGGGLRVQVHSCGEWCLAVLDGGLGPCWLCPDKDNSMFIFQRGEVNVHQRTNAEEASSQIQLSFNNINHDVFMPELTRTARRLVPVRLSVL